MAGNDVYCPSWMDDPLNIGTKDHPAKAELDRLRDKSASDDLVIQNLKDLVMARQAQIDDLSGRLTGKDAKIARLVAFAKGHEAWEADLILDDSDDFIDEMEDQTYQGMVEVQRLRNEAMAD